MLIELSRLESPLGGLVLAVIDQGLAALDFAQSDQPVRERLLRSYPSLAKLSPLAPPDEPSVRPFPVRWKLSETEGPQWDDAWGLFDLTEFNKLEDAIDLFYDRYQRHAHTKVGGWPNYTQSSVGSDDYVFQIGSEEKPRWMWGDNGNGYFFFRDGKWFLYWDCY